MGASAQSSVRKGTTRGNHTSNHENLESEILSAILHSLCRMKDGDFSARLPVAWTGLAGKVADSLNEIMSVNEQMAMELKRISRDVGKEGKARERLRIQMRRGQWGEMEASVNTLVEDLLRPTTEVTRAIAAVAQGNLTQTVRLEVDGRPLEGEFLRGATLVNSMIHQLGVFTEEVTRVAREVGTEGKLGGQASVPGAAGGLPGNLYHRDCSCSTTIFDFGQPPSGGRSGKRVAVSISPCPMFCASYASGAGDLLPNDECGRSMLN